MVGAAIFIGLGAAAWNASRAGGMVVDAFSVPPQYAQSGITGEVVANDLTDKIGAIRDIAQSRSFGNSQNVRKDSAEDIKVEIPEIGVSLGQVQRYLRLWLGHERHLSGNLRLLGEGKIALSMTLDGERGISVSGASGDLDRLEQQAAERIFATIDPLIRALSVGQRAPWRKSGGGGTRNPTGAGRNGAGQRSFPVVRHDVLQHGRYVPVDCPRPHRHRYRCQGYDRPYHGHAACCRNRP